MSDLTPILIASIVFIVWILIAWKVGLAAKTKGRGRILWSILSFLPLGPIIAPLWLQTLPHVGEKATTGQLIGRAIVITLFTLSILGRVGSSAFESVTRNKAKDEFGIEIKDVTSHYKQMSIDEIVTCLQLGELYEELSEGASLDEETDMYLFETQREVEIFNRISALSDELECDDRTYSYTDLDRAMELVKEQTSESMWSSVVDAIGGERSIIQSVISHLDAEAPGMVDETTRFEGASLGRNNEIITIFTLVEYRGAEVMQADLEDVFKPRLESGSCSDTELSYFRKKNYILKYQYSGNDGVPIGTLIVSGACEE